jgi:hypothetical protein
VRPGSSGGLISGFAFWQSDVAERVEGSDRPGKPGAGGPRVGRGAQIRDVCAAADDVAPSGDSVAIRRRPQVSPSGRFIS